MLALYTFVNYHMWQAMDIGNRMAEANIAETRNALVVSQRAWLTVSGVTSGLPVPGEVVNIGIANVGHTPALKVDIAQAAVIGTNEPSIEEVAPQRLNSAGLTTIAAGVPLYLPMNFFKLSTADVNAIRKGSVRLFVVGRIIYADIFDERARNLRFCYYFNPEDDNWSVCHTGNDAD